METTSTESDTKEFFERSLPMLDQADFKGQRSISVNIEREDSLVESEPVGLRRISEPS